MNLLDRIETIFKGGLVLVLALFLFLGCESADDLGLPLEDENINIQYKEFTLPYSLILLDSVNTTRSRILVGKYSSPELGTVSSTSYNNFSIPASNVTISEEGVFDSLVLTLINTYRYGSGNPVNQFYVHQLQDTIGTTRKYSKDAIPYNPTPIGSFSATVVDTVNSTPRHVRLPDAMGTDLFQKVKADAAEVSSTESFQNYFKGLAITGSQANNFVFGFNAPELLMSLYYHIEDDSTLYRYSFEMDTAMQFNQIVADRAGTALANLTEPFQAYQPEDGKLYIQAGAGIVPNVDFSPLNNFIDSISEEVVINRAEFTIATDIPEKFAPVPPSLRLFPVNDNFKRTITTTQSLSGTQYSYVSIVNELTQNPLTMEPDTVNNQLVYSAVVSNYGESILAGNNTHIMVYGDLFAPFEATTIVNRLVTDADRIRLKIFYTTQKK